jgi:hypothetical protein
MKEEEEIQSRRKKAEEKLSHKMKASEGGESNERKL